MAETFAVSSAGALPTADDLRRRKQNECEQCSIPRLPWPMASTTRRRVARGPVALATFPNYGIRLFKSIPAAPLERFNRRSSIARSIGVRAASSAEIDTTQMGRASTRRQLARRISPRFRGDAHSRSMKSFQQAELCGRRYKWNAHECGRKGGASCRAGCNGAGKTEQSGRQAFCDRNSVFQSGSRRTQAISTANALGRAMRTFDTRWLGVEPESNTACVVL